MTRGNNGIEFVAFFFFSVLKVTLHLGAGHCDVLLRCIELIPYFRECASDLQGEVNYTLQIVIILDKGDTWDHGGAHGVSLGLAGSRRPGDTTHLPGSLPLSPGGRLPGG